MDNENIAASGSVPQVTPVQPVAAQPVVGEPKKAKKKTGLIWGIVGGVAALIAIIVLIIVLVLPKDNASDDPTVNEMLKGSLIPFEANDKYGYMDTEGKTVIDPIYDDAEAFHGNYAVAELDDEDVIIDRSGNIKLKFNGYAEYLPDTGYWIIGYILYNDELKQVSADDMVVGTISDGLNYYKFEKPGKIGVIDGVGNVAFEFDDNSRYGGDIDYGDPEYKEFTAYCGVDAGSKYYIVKCSDGSVVVEMDASRFDHAGSTDNNIFYVKYDNDDAEYPGEYRYYYIQDDKVMLEGKYIDDSLYSGSLSVRGSDGETKYFDVCNEKYIEASYKSDCKLTKISDDEDEDFSSYSEYTVKADKSVVKGDNVVIPAGKYSEYTPLKRLTYLYLKALGKEYIIAKNGNSLVLVNLKNGEEVFDFGNARISYSDGSTFVKYRSNGTSYYNLVSGKTFTPDYDGYSYGYADFIIIKNADYNYDYYNTEFKKFYTREN